MLALSIYLAAAVTFRLMLGVGFNGHSLFWPVIAFRIARARLLEGPPE